LADINSHIEPCLHWHSLHHWQNARDSVCTFLVSIGIMTIAKRNNPIGHNAQGAKVSPIPLTLWSFLPTAVKSI